MNKKNMRFLSAYNNSANRYLKDCYRKPSDEKNIAEQSILKEMVACDGWNYRVVGHNTFGFTAGYLFSNKNTGEIMLCVHTPSRKIVMRWL